MQCQKCGPLSLRLPCCLSLSVSVCLSLRDKLLQNHKRLKKKNPVKKREIEILVKWDSHSQKNPSMLWRCWLCVFSLVSVFLRFFFHLLANVSLHAFTVFVRSYQPDLTGEFTLICTKINVKLLCTMHEKKSGVAHEGSTRVNPSSKCPDLTKWHHPRY